MAPCKRTTSTLCLLVAAAASSTLVSAQTYPSRPIRLVAAFSAGSTSDILARIIGPKLHESWGQPVVVENRPAAGGVVAGEIAARATPDGQTLMITSSGFSASAALYAKLPYDSVKDFAGVAQVATGSTVLVAAPAIGVKSVKELIALAKSRPGALNYGSAAAGTINHLAGELFKYMAGVDVVRIAYRGTASVMNALMAGQVQLMFATSASATPVVRAGRLRALAVTSLDRSALFPQLPTMSESGLKGFESVSLHGVFAPAKTPTAIINRLNGAIGQALGQPEVRERLLGSGVEALSGPPAALTTAMNSEIARMGKVIRAAGIRDD